MIRESCGSWGWHRCSLRDASERLAFRILAQFLSSPQLSGGSRLFNTDESTRSRGRENMFFLIGDRSENLLLCFDMLFLGNSYSGCLFELGPFQTISRPIVRSIRGCVFPHVESGTAFIWPQTAPVWQDQTNIKRTHVYALGPTIKCLAGAALDHYAKGMWAIERNISPRSTAAVESSFEKNVDQMKENALFPYDTCKYTSSTWHFIKPQALKIHWQ